MNGLGDSKVNVQQIAESAIHDFEIIDENLIAFAAEDSHIYMYDIRKGVFEE